MLLAAAERGVKINVIAFKEVPQVMYRKYFPVSLQFILLRQLEPLNLLRAADR
jgi:hypothetical protein